MLWELLSLSKVLWDLQMKTTMYSLIPQAAADYSCFVVVFLPDWHTHTHTSGITPTSCYWSHNKTQSLVVRPCNAMSEWRWSYARTMETNCGTGYETVQPNRQEWRKESFSSLRCNSGLLTLKKSRPSHLHIFSFSYSFKENDNCWHSRTASEFLSLKNPNKLLWLCQWYYNFVFICICKLFP